MNKNIYDDVFATMEFKKSLAKTALPDEEFAPRAVYQAIKDELMLDGNSRQNLATFCQTWLDPEIHLLMNDCIDKNMIDKDEYPQTAAIELRCVAMLAELWNAPSPQDTLGCSTIGSSEAAMLAGMALKWKWREKRQKEGKNCDKPNLVTGPVQICWHKFCRYWDVELREIPMEKDRLIMSAEEAIKYVDENTIGVVTTLGVTYTGQYEPVEEVAHALDKYEESTGVDIPIHVDGASGGFLAPFVESQLLWDFRLERVKSINASGHKYGLAPLGVGWVVWREAADLSKDLQFDVNYLGGSLPNFALSFSRPAGQVIAQYYNFLRLGKDGYRKIHQSSYGVASFLAHELHKIGVFKILYDGVHGIPAVLLTLNKEDYPFNLYSLSEKMRGRGWLIPAYSMPKNCTDLVVMRIMVKHGFSLDMAELMLDDLKQAISSVNHKSEATMIGNHTGTHHALDVHDTKFFEPID